MKLQILLFFIAAFLSCNVIDRVEQATGKDKLKYANRTIRSLQAELKSDTRRAIRQLGVREAKSKGDELYQAEAYDKAYYYYDYVNSKKPLDKEVSYRLGVSALAVRDYVNAQENLKFYIGRKEYPLARYYYGISLMHLNEYERAIQQFDRFIVDYKDPDSTLYHIASRYRDGATFGANPRVSTYKIDRLFTNVNSAYTETGPSKINGNSILFTHFDKDAKSSIQRVSLGGIDDPVPLPEVINKSDFINKDPIISPDGETLYFTRCYYGELPECAVYRGKMRPNGDIEEVRKLGEGINLPGFSSMHPCLAVNEFGQEILYFSSDRPGGYGGLDLWFSIRLTTGQYTRAYNCGSRINTDYDEVTPYFENREEMLYFSSNNPETMGGFDVYQAKGEKKYWSKTLSLGVPINSGSDDYYFRLQQADKGYLVSNRNGAPFADYSNCCDDIYTVEKK